MKPLHLADILNQGLADYQQTHKMSVQQKRVCDHIQSCRTGELGYQKWQCDQCGHQTEIGCSCRDRHCPRCQGTTTEDWVDKQSENLLPCSYFHLVFTLPHELNLIAQYNAKPLYQSLFKAVWQTLNKFANNRQHGQLGMTCVLHTWGQNLSQHIHLHCLIPAGSLSTKQQWQSVNKNYLYPVKALSTVFKGKMLAELKAQNVNLNSLNIPQKWCVYAKPCLSHSQQLLSYLARYTRKGVMSESRLVKHTTHSVSFKYKDYRDNNQNKVMTLDTEEFIRRYLQHILPKGLMRVRHYGFLANACRRRKVKLIKAQCKTGKPCTTKPKSDKKMHWPCTECQVGELKLVSILLPSRKLIEPVLTG
nr:IS91 family transposase [Catenovulum sediminis]